MTKLGRTALVLPVILAMVVTVIGKTFLVSDFGVALVGFIANLGFAYISKEFYAKGQPRIAFVLVIAAVLIGIIGLAFFVKGFRALVGVF